MQKIWKSETAPRPLVPAAIGAGELGDGDRHGLAEEQWINLPPPRYMPTCPTFLEPVEKKSRSPFLRFFVPSIFFQAVFLLISEEVRGVETPTAFSTYLMNPEQSKELGPVAPQR